MPWKETRIMEEKFRFIAAVEAEPRGNFARLCASFGISRATGYKWIERFKALGPAGLESCAPVAERCPHTTSTGVERRIVELRKQRPFDGPKKLRALLLQRATPGEVVPAASTIGEILDRNGLIRPRRWRLHVPASVSPLSHAERPNDLWCTDHKGDFELGDGTRCYPLTITDAVSRYLIKCEGVEDKSEERARRHFELAFREFGVPGGMRSDNGTPFATTAIGGLSTLSVWWIQLGIRPERIELGHPEQNGRHERMHLTLKQQTASPPKKTMVAQQAAFDLFRHDFNDVRPHEALGQTAPARHYAPSYRTMPESPRPPEYGAGVITRLVTENGSVSWKGEHLWLSRLLVGQPVGFKLIDEDEWELHYGPVLLGYVLLRAGKILLEKQR